MPSQHEHRVKTFRPDSDGEYRPAQDVLATADVDMNRFLRACLRWLIVDPTDAMRTLAPYLPPVATKGRPKAASPSEARSGVEGCERGDGQMPPASPARDR